MTSQTAPSPHPAAAARENERAQQSAALSAELGLPPEAPWLAAVHQQIDADHLAQATRLTTSLGTLIDALAEVDPTARVEFAGAELTGSRPTEVGSWRGCYADLAIGYAGPEPTLEGRPVRVAVSEVADLLQVLRAAVGFTFEGWKGGDYTMSRDTPVWVAQAGAVGRIGITGVSSDELEAGLVLIHVVDHAAAPGTEAFR